MKKTHTNKFEFRNFIIENLKEKKILIFLFFLSSILLGIIESSVVGSLKPIVDVLQDPGQIKIYNNQINSYLNEDIGPKNFKKIFFLSFVILFLLSGFLNLLCIYLSNKVREYFHYSWKLKLLKNYLNKDISFFNKFQSGDLIQKILVHTREGASFFYETAIILRESFIAITIYILLLFISIKYTIYVSIFAAIIFFITWLVGKLIIVKQTKFRNKSQEQVYSLTEMILRGIKIIKSFNKENFFLDFFINKNRIYKKKEILTTSLIPVPAIILRNIVFIVIIIAAYIVSNIPIENYNLQNISTFIIFIGGFYKINNSFGSINNAILSSSRLYPSLQIISQEIQKDENQKNYEEETDQKFDLNSFKKNLEFNKISYKYSGNNNSTLNNLNFKFIKSSTNLIVGPSGSGKSTLIDIILGFKNASGEIRVDDQKNVNIKNKRFINYSYLSQNSLLFPGTIRENIIFFEKLIDQEYYNKIVNICKIKDILEKFSSDYNLENNESYKLSEGQKQRICLARTLYSNKPIIILDEALSNIEVSLEKQIIDDVLKLVKEENKTLIVVSHSLKNYENVDQINVINNGKIEQKGTHDELKNLEGFYKKNF